MGGVALFTANDGIHGEELWTTDGTPEGTFLVRDVSPGAASAGFESIIVAGSIAFFVATTPDVGRELWKTDGTEAGTVLVKDINPTGSANFSMRAALGGVLYFGVDDGVHGVELWKSDGTESGTVLVKDIRPGPASSTGSFSEVVGNQIIFNANDGVTGFEMWTTDGTETGTRLIKNIAQGAETSNPHNFKAAGGLLFFAADDHETDGPELWVTDGTETGTSRVADINVGPVGSHPQALAELRDLLLFNAFNSDFGGEMWQSDGTEAGTVLVSDIWPGPFSSGPGDFTVVGRKLFLTAEDLLTGRELWVADLPNQLPVANAGPDVEVGEGVAVTLDGTGSFDPDGEELTFEWRDSQGTLLGSSAVLNLPALEPGEYEITLTVSDGTDIDFDTVLVNVLGPPAISVVDAFVVEGNRGFSQARIRVELSRASTDTVSAFYITLPQSALPLFDFIPEIGIIELAPGAVDAEVDVAIIGNQRCEPDEVFRVELFLPSNATVGDGSAIVTVLDDDCVP